MLDEKGTKLDPWFPYETRYWWIMSMHGHQILMIQGTFHALQCNSDYPHPNPLARPYPQPTPLASRFPLPHPLPPLLPRPVPGAWA